MKINKNTSVILKILSIIILFLSLFYWFEWRPAQIRTNCTKKVLDYISESNMKNSEDISLLFDLCLSQNGLKR